MPQWVLVSGGNGVLGQAFARGLQDDGYRVVCLDQRPPPEGTRAAGSWFECDITNEEDVANLRRHVESLDGQVYGLINNASCQPVGFGLELDDYSADVFRRVLDVNLTGSFLLTQLAVGFMKANHSGSIVNIGSIQGVVAPTFEIYEGTNITSPLAYAVAKAGLIHFSKWVAAKYGPYGIRSNSISPGGVADSQRGGSAFAEVYAARTPLRRMADSSEVADAVRFLVGPKAAYITGQNILVDGGWTAS